MPSSRESALERLLSSHREGRLGHAHLITGAAGSGKTWVAQRLAAGILGCSAEGLLAHPDAHFVQPESKSRRILAEQIRTLETSLHRKPLLSRNKTAILTDADRLQPAAANAFLKTLEEPPEGCFLILTTSLPDAVLETILSRCMETSLQGGSGEPGQDGLKIIAELERCLLTEEGPTVAGAYRLARAVQSVLAEIRERVSAEHAALFKAEAARYKNAADNSGWLEEREDQLKALTESAALREREHLLGAVFYALGGAARAASGGDSPHPVCERLARHFSPAEIFDKIEAFETLRRRLALNVNEALVLEAGFLEIALGRNFR